MLYPTALKLKYKYRCAICWGPLDLFLTHEHDSYHVACAREPTQHANAGYVSNHFVAEAKDKDAAQYLEVVNGLKKAGVIGYQPLGTADEIKKQLGY
jgi:hypothetical protein